MTRRTVRAQAVLVAILAVACACLTNLTRHTTSVSPFGSGWYLWVDYGRVQLRCGGDFPTGNSHGISLVYMPDLTWSWWVSGHDRPVQEQLLNGTL